MSVFRAEIHAASQPRLTSSIFIISHNCTGKKVMSCVLEVLAKDCECFSSVLLGYDSKM